MVSDVQSVLCHLVSTSKPKVCKHWFHQTLRLGFSIFWYTKFARGCVIIRANFDDVKNHKILRHYAWYIEAQDCLLPVVFLMVSNRSNHVQSFCFVVFCSTLTQQSTTVICSWTAQLQNGIYKTTHLCICAQLTTRGTHASKNTHPLLWQTCKVLHPWAFFMKLWYIVQLV